MASNDPDQLRGIVEAYETFVGGKTKKRKNGKTRGGPQDHQKPVLDFVLRHGKVITKVIDAPFRKVIMPILKSYVTPESVLVTDGSQAYFPAKKHFAGHKIMSYSTGVYKRGIYHTNTIEGYWSRLK